MKKPFKNLILLVLSALTVLSLILSTGAVNTADAVEKIDTTKQCSLTLTYGVTEKKQVFQGLEIELYCVAVASEDYEFTASDKFSAYSMKVDKLKSQAEWDALTSTALGYIEADGIEPSYTRVTNENGVVKFSGLKCGTYIVRWSGNKTEDDVSGFPPYMIALPYLDGDGKPVYDIDAFPKPGEAAEKYTDYKVVKYWKDENANASRPEVLIDIYKNNQPYSSVRLNAENNWCYTWTSNETDTWNVVERNVPKGYTVTAEQKGNVFTVTNFRDSQGKTPQTGVNDSNIILIAIIAVAGLAVLLIGLIGRRRRNA